jgi:hypothetical protein
VFCKLKKIHSFLTGCGSFLRFFEKTPDFYGLSEVSPVDKPVENVDNSCVKLCGKVHKKIIM